MPNAKILLPIFLVVLVDVFGFALVIPLQPIYAETLHATAFEATLLVSIYALFQLVSGPLIGRASDRVGRKPMLVLSQVGTCAGFLVFAQAKSLWLLFLARAIDGATAGNMSLAQAYISDHTAPKDRARAFGLVGISFGVGFFIGPFVTGVLVKYGMAAPVYAAAALSFTSIVCTLTLLEGGPPKNEFAEATRGGPHATASAAPRALATNPPPRSGFASYLTRPVLGGLLAQFALFSFCFSTYTSGFALYAERRLRVGEAPFGPRETGYLFAYVGLVGIFMQGFAVPRLVKRLGEPWLVSLGFLCLATGYFGLGVVATVPLVLVSVTISSVGQGMLRPALTALITHNAGRGEQGAVLGLTQSLMSLAAIVAPPLGGYSLGRGHLATWAWVASAAAALGCAAAHWGSARAVRTT